MEVRQFQESDVVMSEEEKAIILNGMCHCEGCTELRSHLETTAAGALMRGASGGHVISSFAAILGTLIGQLAQEGRVEEVIAEELPLVKAMATLAERAYASITARKAAEEGRMTQ